MKNKLFKYQNTNIFLTIFFNIYVLTWWLELNKRVSILGTIRFEFIIAAILCALALNSIDSQIKSKYENKKILKAIFFYFLTLIISLVLSIDISVSWNVFFNRVVKLAAMTLFMAAFIKTPRDLSFFLTSTFFSFFKIGQEAFLGKITGSMVWENQGVMRLYGAVGTMFGHPNSLSGKTVSLLPYLWYLTGVVKKYWLVLFLVQVVFSINIIIFTGSRTGYIATSIFLLILFLSTKRKLGMLAFILVIVVSIIVFAPAQYKMRFESSFTGQEVEGRSTEKRIGLLKDSIYVFLEQPYGVGMGCFKVIQAKSGRNAQETHNLYTQILSEIGIQGFLAFFYLVLTISKSLLSTRKKTRALIDEINSQHHGNVCLGNVIANLKLIEAVCISTLVMIFVRMCLGVFGHDLYEIYWWIAAGLALSLSNIFSNCQKIIEDILANG